MYGWAQQPIWAMQMQMAAVMQQQQLQPQYYQPFVGGGARPYEPLSTDLRNNSAESSDDEDDEQNRTLFVANLDDRVTEELLYECFVQAGPIESVRIPKDNTGKKRSFGFVTYMHSCSTPYAQKLYQGLALFHKTLTIRFQGNGSAHYQQRRFEPIGVDCSGGGVGAKYPLDVEPLKRRSYDNSSLRGSNYPGYYDPTMNDAGGRNPFKASGSGSDWTLGSASRQNKDRISRVSRKSRSPIEKHRHEPERNDRQRDDRRSEQRNRHRR